MVCLRNICINTLHKGDDDDDDDDDNNNNNKLLKHYILGIGSFPILWLQIQSKPTLLGPNRQRHSQLLAQEVGSLRVALPIRHN
jgi:hypothetical protein